MSVALPPKNDGRDFRFSIDLLRKLHQVYHCNDKESVEFERVLNAYAELPGPYLATRNATLNVFVQLRQVYDELVVIIGE